MDLFEDAPNGFNLYHGNELERLGEMLGSRLGECRGGDPLKSDVVVVQSRGMARWLNMALAAGCGVAANLNFPFPRHFIEKYVFSPLARSLGEKTIDFSYFAPENLTWRLAAIIPEVLAEPDFQVLNRYLAGENRRLKLVQLAERIAGLFDQYMTYRPDLINAWDRGENPLASQPDSHWQKRLWQLAAGDSTRRHPAFYYQVLLAQIYPELYEPELRIPAAPADFRELRELERVFFFGFSSIAPVYLDIIFAVSRLVKVDFYYLNPCAEYWEYNRAYRVVLREAGKKIRSRVESAAIKETAAFNVACDESAFECANPLLGAWGEQGREFFALINSASPTRDEPLFDRPEMMGTGTMLQRLQADITGLTVSRSEFPLDPDDDSIQFHSCHSRMREVEVLYENLLHMFAGHPGLRPEDVLVLTPDINIYAPYIEAVFNTVSPDSPKWFHATIADRSSTVSRPEVSAWLRLMTLDRERFSATAVLDLLEVEAIRRRCNLDARDMERLRVWLKETGINWGIDAEYRQECSGYAFEQNSWRFGLERMLAGFAMMPDRDRGRSCWESCVGDLLPYENIEGDGAVLLGKLCDFFDRLTALHRLLRQYETENAAADTWYALLNRTVDDFLESDRDNVDGIQAVREAVEAWFGEVTASGSDLTGKIGFDLATIIYCLRKRLEGEGSTGGFLQGGVTFCQAKPLRSIPSRVICMLGMDDGAFPRQDRRLSFDLLGAGPRLGDRSARNDDRYLFLETMLSAREIFYISYIGQNLKENTTLPPSVLISELLEYLAGNYVATKPGETASAHRMRVTGQLVVRHPLQAFSRKYFDAEMRVNSRLRSYSEENFRAAEMVASVSRENPVGTRRLLVCDSPCPEELLNITLRELGDFLKNPAAAFCRRRLGIDLALRDSTSPDDREPFTINALERYLLGSELLRCYLRSPGGGEEIMAMVKKDFNASGRLPVGAQGEVAFQRFEQEFSPFLERAKALLSAPLPAVSVSVPFPEAGVTLDVSLDDLFRCHDGANRQLFFRFGKSRPVDVLQVRLYHLALGLPEVAQALNDSPVAETVLLVKGKPVTCGGPVTGAETVFGELIGYYLKGMAGPAAFEPESSLAVWKALSAGLPEIEALAKGRDAWPRDDDEYTRYDEYLRFCFGDSMPEDGDFAADFLRNSRLVFDALPPEGGGV